MATSHIVKLPRTDETGYVLGLVTSDGPKPLDIKLAVTEGQAIYTVQLRHGRINELRDGGNACSESEWERILSSTLLGGVTVEDIEAGATVQQDRATVITIRRRVTGINQRLGVITLRSKDEEIELFDWCGDAVDASGKIKADLALANARSENLEQEVSDLKEQLAELLAVKNTGERLLLSRFRGLLNEKKARISQQARLLGSAKSRVSTLTSSRSRPSDMQPVRADSSSRTARGSKRKAAQAAPRDNESDDGFEDAKEETPEQREKMEDRETSDDPDETASEPDQDKEDEPMEDASTHDDSHPVAAGTTNSKGKGTKAPSPPPKQTRLATRAATAAVADPGSETESDDEL